MIKSYVVNNMGDLVLDLLNLWIYIYQEALTLYKSRFIHKLVYFMF